MMTTEEIESDLCGDAQHDAAVWYAYLKRSDSTEAVWLAFMEWLERDEAHRLAYGNIEHLHETLDEVGDRLAPLVAKPATGRVIPFRPSRMRKWMAAGAGAALAASVLIALLPGHGVQSPLQRYETGADETRSVTLADGTAIDLNRDTVLTASLTATGRQIRLDHGEALFHVAADPARRFIVLAGTSEIRDIGTIFDVVRTPAKLVVGVVEGRVAVSGSNGGAPTLLAAGDQLAVADGEQPSVSHGAPAAVSSWVKGFLVYDNTPFSKVINDFNRYGKMEIVQQGADSTFMAISGVIEIADQEVMLDRLGHMTPLLLDHSHEGRILVRAVTVSK